MRSRAEHTMTEHANTGDEASERQKTQMPDFQLNRNPDSEATGSETPADGSGPSRRGFLAASAVAGLGAASMAAPASADDDDEYDDDSDDDNADENEMNDGSMQVDAGAGFTVQDIVDNPEGERTVAHCQVADLFCLCNLR